MKENTLKTILLFLVLIVVSFSCEKEYVCTVTVETTISGQFYTATSTQKISGSRKDKKFFENQCTFDKPGYKSTAKCK